MEVLITYATTSFALQDYNQIGEARRAVQKACAKLNFSEQTCGNASIVVTELGTNLVKHAKGGTLLINAVWVDSGSWIEILSVDQGPGIDNIEACMADGFSSQGTSGNGLGAIRRMSCQFDVLSKRGVGTVILSRISNEKDVSRNLTFEIGAINLPKSGEPVSGDSWAIKTTEDNLAVFVADGLGHGISAADASTLAVRAFSEEVSSSPVDILKSADLQLRSTRGAAAAIACINPKENTVRYAGIGNISSMVIYPDLTSKSMVSQNGIIGHGTKRFTEFSYPWCRNAILVMYSDGLQSHVNLQKYEGLFRRDPALIAAVLWSEHTRDRDDATVVVLK